jgi:hypothetical protein
MSAGDQNYSRAAQFKCLSDSTVPLSVWIVQITAARPCTRFPQHKSVRLWVQGNPVVRKGTGAKQNRPGCSFEWPGRSVSSPLVILRAQRQWRERHIISGVFYCVERTAHTSSWGATRRYMEYIAGRAC